MRKYITIVMIGMVFLFSGCSLSRYYDGKTPTEIEQYENPMIWREVLRIQVTLWPLEKKVKEMDKEVREMAGIMQEMEKKVNDMRDELATIKLSSIQANKGIESLQKEIQKMTNESVREEHVKRKADDLQSKTSNKKDMLKMRTSKAAGESKKDDTDIPSITIQDIQYSKVSDTEDKVLIYVNAMNNPKLQMLRGENPRIVLDFLNTRSIDKEQYEIITDGNFIKRIRIRTYKEPLQKVRIVFDMVPNKKYSVDQKFSKKENFYSFHVKPQ